MPPIVLRRKKGIYMKQIGNLAVVCAGRKDVMLQIYEGMVSVHYGVGPTRETVTARWDDDEAISAIVYELNFGKGAEQRKEREAA